MRDNRGAFRRIRDVAGDVGARYGDACRAQLFVAARMIGMDVRVDDVLQRLCRGPVYEWRRSLCRRWLPDPCPPSARPFRPLVPRCCRPRPPACTGRPAPEECEPRRPSAQDSALRPSPASVRSHPAGTDWSEREADSSPPSRTPGTSFPGPPKVAINGRWYMFAYSVMNGFWPGK